MYIYIYIYAICVNIYILYTLYIYTIHIYIIYTVYIYRDYIYTYIYMYTIYINIYIHHTAYIYTHTCVWLLRFSCQIHAPWNQRSNGIYIYIYHTYLTIHEEKDLLSLVHGSPRAFFQASQEVRIRQVTIERSIVGTRESSSAWNTLRRLQFPKCPLPTVGFWW